MGLQNSRNKMVDQNVRIEDSLVVIDHYNVLIDVQTAICLSLGTTHKMGIQMPFASAQKMHESLSFCLRATTTLPGMSMKKHDSLKLKIWLFA